MSSTLVNDSPVLWRFLSGDQEAFCIIQPHPSGHELRYIFNGVQLIGVVSANWSELHDRAHQWRQRLLAEGWIEAEPRMQPIGRARVAGVM
ncbi:MAG TPA: hypothetical protein VIL35_09235 [Vicinamibacterales bacterium]